MERNGAQGVRVITTGDDVILRWEFWLKNNTMYSLLGYTNRGQIDEYLGNRFFNSFVILPPRQKSMEDFIHEVGAFAIKMPGNPQYFFNSVPQQLEDKEIRYELHNYMATDRERMTNYWIRYNDHPAGYFLQNRAELVNGLHEQLKSMAKDIQLSEPSYKNGMERTRFTVQFERSNAFVELWFRGNRVYFLMQENLNIDNKEIDSEYFDSFRILPYKQMPWKTFTIDEMQIDLPSETLVTDTESEINDMRISIYAAVDSNSATAYSIEKMGLPKYFRLEATDSLYYSLYSGVKGINEKLLSFETKTKDDIVAAIYSGQDTGFKNYNKRVIWTRGDNLYIVSALADSLAVANIDIDKLIRSIRFAGTPAVFDLYSSKAELIAKDLLHTDTLIANQAKRAIQTYYTFNKDELSAVHEALKHTYSDDQTRDGIRVQLINDLVRIHDEHSVELLKEIMQQPSSTDVIRAAILSNILFIDSTQHDWHLAGLHRYRPEAGSYVWQLFHPMRDSLGYTLHQLDKVIPLFDVTSYRPPLLDICLTIAKDSTLGDAKESIGNYLPTITKYMHEELESFLADGGQTDFGKQYFIANYIKLLAAYGQKELIQKAGKKLIGLDSVELLQAVTVTSFLALDLPIAESVLRQSYENLYKRSIVMNGLQQADRLDIVPAVYKEETEIGKMIVHEFVSTEWDVPSQIEFLGELNEQGQRYLVYTFQLAGDGDTYRAVYRPEGLEQLEYDYTNCFSDFETGDTADWRADARKIIEQANTYEETYRQAMD